MPLLNQTQWNKLYSQPLSRNGTEVPTTAPDPNQHGNDPNAGACWCWALAGRPVNHGDPANVDDMFANIFTLDNAGHPTGFNDQYLNGLPTRNQIQPYLNSITAYVNGANNGDANAITQCRGNLLLIAAVNAGLQPVNDTVASDYRLLANINPNDAWYARFDHFALQFTRPGAGTLSYVQKVPDTGIRFGCDRMWDEGYPQTTFKIAQLLQQHVDVINLIP